MSIPGISFREFTWLAEELNKGFLLDLEGMAHRGVLSSEVRQLLLVFRLACGTVLHTSWPSCSFR